jgi:hypothetical protein
MAASVDLRSRNFRPGDCAVVEGCVGGTGKRRLLRFDVVTPNIGAADVVLGPPQSRPDLFEYSPCHGHYHLHGYAEYALLAADGTTVVRGRKQAFCLLDSMKYDPAAGPSNGYTCGNQGITAGWADVYSKYLDCQWIDVTQVRPGTYQLRVQVNAAGVLTEADYANNTATIPVAISK